MHRNVAIPDYRSLVTQTSGMDICQIGYDICEFDSLRGLGIEIFGRIHLIIEIDLLYGWAVLERRPNHANKRVVADIWLLTVSWTLTWEMIRIRNFYCFEYRQHIWLRKWEMIVGGLMMLGFMDLRWPRVCRRSTSVLFYIRKKSHSSGYGSVWWYTANAHTDI